MVRSSSVPFLSLRILAAVLLPALAACSSGPLASGRPGAPDTASVPPAVEVSLSTRAELEEAYGWPPAVNPFLPPPSLASGFRNAFLAVRFTAGAPVSLEIGEVFLEDGGRRLEIRLLGRRELAVFWETRTITDGTAAADARNDRRRAAIDRYALDLDAPNALRKGSPYTLVVLGPPARELGAARLTVRYYVDGVPGEAAFPAAPPGD